MVLEAKGGSTFSDEEVVKIKPERALCLHLKAQRLRPDGKDWRKSEQ